MTQVDFHQQAKILIEAIIGASKIGLHKTIDTPRGATSAEGQLTQNTRQHFDASLDTCIPVLDPQRREISAFDAEIQSQANLRRNLVTLYKALGGGW